MLTPVVSTHRRIQWNTQYTCICCRYEETMQLYQDMQAAGLCADAYTLTALMTVRCRVQSAQYSSVSHICTLINAKVRRTCDKEVVMLMCCFLKCPGLRAGGQVGHGRAAAEPAAGGGRGAQHPPPQLPAQRLRPRRPLGAGALRQCLQHGDLACTQSAAGHHCSITGPSSSLQALKPDKPRVGRSAC